MTWQLFIGVSVIFYSIATLLQRFMLKESNSRPIAFAIVFQLVIAAMMGAVGWLMGDLHWPDTKALAFNLVIMVVLYTIGNIGIFRSLKTVEASKFTILFATRGLFTILASTLFLHEGLSLWQLLGALSIFAGVTVVNWQGRGISLGKGEWLALMAGLCFGLANTNDRFLLSSMSVYTFTSVGFLLPGLVLSVVYPQEAKAATAFLNKALLGKMLALCAFYAASALAFFFALQLTDNSSQIAAINLSSVIIIVLLSVIFLGERDHLLKKLVGAGLAFAGLLLIQ